MDLNTHGISAIIRNNDGKFLIVKEGRDVFNGSWAPPYGTCEVIDKSEEESVIREIKEKVNLNIMPLKKLITLTADKSTETFSIWSVKLLGGELKIDRNKLSESRWCSMEEVLNLKLFPAADIFFKKIKSGEIEL